MSYRLLADGVLLLHLAFILWATLGGLLLLRWPRLAWLQVPAALWGAGIELAAGICPLTPLENRLRLAAGEAGYAGSFVDHYLLPLIYPPGLTADQQWLLGALVAAINLACYAGAWRRYRRRLPPGPPGGRAV